MINLIPMAGLGTRFSNQGYKLSKPLIPVSGMPMIIKVIRDLPNAKKWIFVMRKEHIKDGVDKIIKKEIPRAIIIGVKKTTEGQASTCLIAEKYLEKEEELFIASCDNGFLYNKDKFKKIKKEKDIDSIVWTFTKMEKLKKNPYSWGWCELEKDKKTIKNVSIKKPISKSPYKDHAVVATFWFKKSKDFIKAAKMMIEENYRINNEFYVDAIPIYLKKMGKKSVIFDVDLYVGWGTPEDLHEYELIEFFVKYGKISNRLTKEQKRLLPLWKKYFKNG